MRLERVIVGIDFNRASIQAARWVAHWFARRAELILLHAFAPIEEQVGAEATERATVEARLLEVRKAIGKRHVRTEVRSGPPARCLAEAAAELQADLIVVGAPPHNVWPELAEPLGATAEKLVQCSPVPVLLAAGALDGPPQRLLVPLDEAPVSA